MRVADDQFAFTTAASGGGKRRDFSQDGGSTHRLHTSSSLGLPYRILNMNPKMELLWSLWVETGLSELKKPLEEPYMGTWSLEHLWYPYRTLIGSCRRT